MQNFVTQLKMASKETNSKLGALKDRPVSLPRPLTLLAADIFAFASRGKANVASLAKLAIKLIATHLQEA